MNAVEKKGETKTQIMEVARPLFSEQGFDGTSIRQIAEKCGVNIAAINYHFGGKENLYWAIIFDSCEWMEQQAKEVVTKCETFEDVARGLFAVLTSNGDYVLSTMRTYLSSMVPPPEADHPLLKKMMGEEPGPPGGETVVKFLSEKYPETNEESRQWATMALFANLFHLSSVVATPIYRNYKQQFLPLKLIEDNIARTAKALCKEMTGK